jgi:hypothetical protein
MERLFTVMGCSDVKNERSSPWKDKISSYKHHDIVDFGSAG